MEEAVNRQIKFYRFLYYVSLTLFYFSAGFIGTIDFLTKGTVFSYYETLWKQHKINFFNYICGRNYDIIFFFNAFLIMFFLYKIASLQVNIKNKDNIIKKYFNLLFLSYFIKENGTVLFWIIFAIYFPAHLFINFFIAVIFSVFLFFLLFENFIKRATFSLCSSDEFLCAEKYLKNFEKILKSR
jgi:hypothetical protein